MFLVLLLYALFASVFTISKTGLEYAQPFFLVGSRMVFAGFLMLGYQYFFQRQSFKFAKKDFWRILKLAVFCIYLTNVFEFWGLKYLTSFKTCFIYSLSPFLSALFSYWMFSEKLSSKKWIGLAVGFLGFLPILLSETGSEELTGYFFVFSWAELAVVGAAIFSVYGWILLAQLVRDNGYTPFMANGLSMVLGGAIALVHSFLVESWDPLPVTDFWPFAACALLLILVSNLVCYNLYGFLLKRFSATFMSLAGFSTPVFTAIFGWFYLGEVVNYAFYLSGAIVFVGLTIFYQEEIKQGLAISKPIPAIVRE